MLPTYFLIFSILAGQLLKLPVSGNLGPTLLDFSIIILSIFGLLKLKFHLKKLPFFIKGALVFIFISIISLIFTPLHLSQSEYLISFSYTLRFIFYLLFSWIIYLGAFPKIKKNIANIFIYSGLGLAVFGLLQLIFIPNLDFLASQGWDPHYFRTVSTFLDPNFAGAFFTLSLLIILNSRITRKWIIFFAIIYLALLTTFSRGAYLAFLVSLSAFSLKSKSFKKLIITFLLFLGLLTGFYLYQLLIATPRGIDRVQSAQSREESWKQGKEVFLHSPILGVGFNAYKFALREYNLADSNFLQSHGSSTNDSSLLYVSSTTGIIGLTSYLFFLFALLKFSWKEKILPAGLLGLAGQSFFSNTLFYSPLLIWILLMAATFKPLREKV